MSRAFLVFGTSMNLVDPRESQITGQITNATTLTFQRLGTGGAVTVSWYVVEFLANVTVQRGTATITNASPFNVPLAAVNTARSFPIITFRTEGGNVDHNDFVRARITSGTNLQLTHNLTGFTTPEVVEWQVVEYLDASVQTNTVDLTFADADLSRTATLAAAVNLNKSWLILSYECDASPGGCATPANTGAKMIRGA
ncbi:MAG TPA: hypothetical protein VI589_05640, partial [Vicinamibacteria bacterium]